MTGNPIPRYHLYGEDDTADDFDFFHIETIRARSEPLGWSLGPHSHVHLFQCLMITAGFGGLLEEAGERALEPSAIVFTPPGVTHGWTFSPDTEGYVVSFTHDYLSGGGDGQDLLGLLAQQEPGNTLVAPREYDHVKIVSYLEEMAAEYRDSRRRRMIFRPLLTLMLTRLFSGRELTGVIDPAPDFSLLQFRALVDVHFRTDRSPEFYAGEMGMTVARLNRFCRIFTDRTASQSIRERIVLEAKRLLVFSKMSVSQIAYDLGYDDPAYFSRVFRKETGQSPQEFRMRPKS